MEEYIYDTFVCSKRLGVEINNYDEDNFYI